MPLARVPQVSGSSLGRRMKRDAPDSLSAAVCFGRCAETVLPFTTVVATICVGPQEADWHLLVVLASVTLLWHYRHPLFRRKRLLR